MLAGSVLGDGSSEVLQPDRFGFRAAAPAGVEGEVEHADVLRDPLHRFCDLPLVAVRGGGVNVPVAGSDRRLDRGPGLLSRGLEHAQTQRGHDDAIVQRQSQISRHAINSSFLSGDPQLRR